MNWRDDPLVVFDVESTGVNTDADRIVSACVAMIPKAVSGGGPRTPRIFSFLVNPGIEIPQGAIDVHGLSNEHVQKHGIEPPRAIEKIVGLLRLSVEQGLPIIAMNARFDLTMLDREAERYGIEPVADGPDRLRPVVDPYVIDKAADPYRKGKRKLENQCENWGVKLEGAHDSTVDALAAGRVAYRMAWGPIPRALSDRGYDWDPIDIGAMKLDDLHDAQVGWAAKQAKSFARWLRGKAAQEPDSVERERMLRDADGCRPEWPFVPRPSVVVEDPGQLW